MGASKTPKISELEYNGRTSNKKDAGQKNVSSNKGRARYSVFQGTSFRKISSAQFQIILLSENVENTTIQLVTEVENLVILVTMSLRCFFVVSCFGMHFRGIYIFVFLGWGHKQSWASHSHNPDTSENSYTLAASYQLKILA